jgi:2'-5' RNA ligase
MPLGKVGVQAVVSVLDPHYYRQVEGLWEVLERCCELTGIRLTPLPHMSWQVAERYEVEAVTAALKAMSRRLEPMIVHTAGLGVFTGEAPVLYLPVVKSQELLDRHRLLWEALESLGRGVSRHYQPDRWIPHITLAHGEIKAKQVAKATEVLAKIGLSWEITLDNLALVGQEGEDSGKLIQGYGFDGSSFGGGE